VIKARYASRQTPALRGGVIDLPRRGSTSPHPREASTESMIANELGVKKGLLFSATDYALA
jgi:hypothetical protein